MSKVVFTAISSLDRLACAVWFDGAQDSYEATKQMAQKARRHEDDFIFLIGREGKDGRVQVTECANPGREWRVCNARHLRLADYFMRRLADAPKEKFLAPFFEEIDSEVERNDAVQLIAAECGTNGDCSESGEVHMTILDIMGVLDRLGVPAGDWTFDPMMNAYRASCEA